MDDSPGGAAAIQQHFTTLFGGEQAFGQCLAAGRSERVSAWVYRAFAGNALAFISRLNMHASRARIDRVPDFAKTSILSFLCGFAPLRARTPPATTPACFPIVATF